MSTDPLAHRDRRPLWLRLLVWAGLVVLALCTPVFLLFGLASIAEPDGKFILCCGLVLLVATFAAAAREVVERRLVRDPVRPRLETLPDGEQALTLARATAPTSISSWGLLGFGVALALGAIFAALEQSWVLAVVVALAALWLMVTAVPHRASEMAGGLWLTPTRLIDDYRGIRWELPWEGVTGVDAHRARRVLVSVRRDRLPPLERTGPRGRAWKPLVAGNVLKIDTDHLAGGSVLAGYVITKALTDPGSRTVLGTPESLPPHQ